MAATDEANTFRGEWVNKIFFFKGIPKNQYPNLRLHSSS